MKLSKNEKGLEKQNVFQRHLILINFKTYEQGTGKGALRLAKAIGSFKSDKYRLAVAPQMIDVKGIAKRVRIPVLAQHMDSVGFGSHTGGILPEAVKEAGAKGTLINHSERPLSLGQIKKVVEICKRLGLKSVVCASSLSLVKKVVRLEPDFIAYEPKRLIGRNVSVTQANPKVIVKAVKLIEGSKTKLLVGAGVHSKRDIQKAVEFGAQGVLIAHKVVKAKKVRKVLGRLLG